MGCRGWSVGGYEEGNVRADVSSQEIHGREEGEVFMPRFNEDGLICAVCVEYRSQKVLMVAWMNREALDLTLSSGYAHYYSRSRKTLWKKGETSGNVQKIVRVLVDCDQDALVLEVDMGDDIRACHTGRMTCFYREILFHSSDQTVRLKKNL